MDYQTQQQKLFPLIAAAYIQSAGTEYVNILYGKMIEKVNNKDFSMMEVMHHITAGMKSVYSQISIDGILVTRQSIGGAGFTNWSAIPSFYDDLSPTVTFEGDNTVMAQQAFKYLMKQGKKFLNNKETNDLLPIFKYLETINHVD